AQQALDLAAEAAPSSSGSSFLGVEGPAQKKGPAFAGPFVVPEAEVSQLVRRSSLLRRRCRRAAGERVGEASRVVVEGADGGRAVRRGLHVGPGAVRNLVDRDALAAAA